MYPCSELGASQLIWPVLCRAHGFANEESQLEIQDMVRLSFGASKAQIRDENSSSLWQYKHPTALRGPVEQAMAGQFGSKHAEVWQYTSLI